MLCSKVERKALIDGMRSLLLTLSLLFLLSFALPAQEADSDQNSNYQVAKSETPTKPEWGTIVRLKPDNFFFTPAIGVKSTFGKYLTDMMLDIGFAVPK